MSLSPNSAAKSRFLLSSWPQSLQLEEMVSKVPGISMIQQKCCRGQENAPSSSLQAAQHAPCLRPQLAEGPRTPSRLAHRLHAQQRQLLCVCVCPPWGPHGYLSHHLSLPGLPEADGTSWQWGLMNCPLARRQTLCIAKDFIPIGEGGGKWLREVTSRLKTCFPLSGCKEAPWCCHVSSAVWPVFPTQRREAIFGNL